MTYAAILFAVAALGGVVLAAIRFGGRELPPMGLAIVHGLFAAAGLVTLIVAVLGAGFTGWTAAALVGFIIAAIGGFVLFSYHLRGQALPKNYIVGHGTVAVVSFVILLLAIFVFRH